MQSALQRRRRKATGAHAVRSYARLSLNVSKYSRNKGRPAQPALSRPVAIGAPIKAQAHFEVNLASLPPPERGFSADAVFVQPVPTHRSVNIFFVAADPQLTKPVQWVRVRIPMSNLVEQVARDTQFKHALGSYMTAVGFGPVWIPTLDQLAAIDVANTATVEGSHLTMSHLGDAAQCDIIRIPPDLVGRVRAGVTPDITAVLRVSLPTVVLHKLLESMLELAPMTAPTTTATTAPTESER